METIKPKVVAWYCKHDPDAGSAFDWKPSRCPAKICSSKRVPLVRLSDYERLQAECERLQAECEKLRKDAERLDWLADPENQIGEVLLPTEVVEQNPHSMRDAIDAAMESMKHE